MKSLATGAEMRIIMKHFTLLHADTSGVPKHPAYQIAVGIGQSAEYAPWKDMRVMGYECMSAREWDEMVDKLIKSLESVRSQGHAKLSKSA